MRNAIIYKGIWLVMGSTARKLFDERRYNDLDRHMGKLHREAIQRGELRL